LIGKKVLNAGAIRTPGGYTILAAGDSIYLNPEGSDVVVEVSDVTLPDAPAVDGLGDVVNTGIIESIDGGIIMAAGDTFSRAIDGVDQMTVAVGSDTGTVRQLGTLVADGSEGDGGSITLTATDAVVLGENSVTTANAGANGDGGEVTVYSTGTTIFENGATLEVKGGGESGDGGFAEISGDEIIFAGHVDASAANGKFGTLLMDPASWTIKDEILLMLSTKNSLRISLPILNWSPTTLFTWKI
jgi:hypothetical protein